MVAVGGAGQSGWISISLMKSANYIMSIRSVRLFLPYVCGNGHYLALGDPYQNLQFGVVNQSSSDEQKSCFEPIHSLEINFWRNLSVIGAPMFCFLIRMREK